ncbi:MAG: hypothetical protein KGI57_00785 [Hyphomicrobiales bacterium]|nr:hypothetical protein [Hyphomicrobiales bacterium]MDE2016221.1 hypothetical protein [Hyphomicrobiales bacterium]
MTRTLAFALAIAAFGAVAAPAYAADDCATKMKAVHEAMMTSHDAAKNKMAGDHMMMASDKMKAHDEAGCAMQADDAMKALK